jgi:XRE family transcriptional regulator, regulator of sulfur utilization
MKLGQAIKRLRVNHARQGQAVFSQNIGISQTYLSQIETDGKEPSTDLLQRIANYLEMPLPLLFWFAVSEEDIKPDRIEYFRVVRPAVDELIKTLF